MHCSITENSIVPFKSLGTVDSISTSHTIVFLNYDCFVYQIFDVNKTIIPSTQLNLIKVPLGSLFFFLNYDLFVCV